MNKKIVIGSIIVLCTAGLVAAGIIRSTGGAGARAVEVDAVRIEKGEISSYISSDGIIEEVEKSEVFFDTPLKVNKLFIDIGSAVEKGDRIMEVDVSALRSQLKTLEINRNTQQISLNSKAMDAEVERAHNNLKAAERNYNDSKKAYEDNMALYKANAISKAELDMSEKAFIESESGISGMKNAQIAYDTALENRKNARKSGQENLKAIEIQVADIEKKLSSIEEACKRPMAGGVANLGVQEGAFTNSMQAAYKIINPDRLQVRARVKEYDIKNVAADQKAKITGEAIPEDVEVTGYVKNISPIAVSSMTSSGNETIVEILVEIDSSDGILKPGLNVTCEISSLSKKDVLLAPMEAIIPDVDDNFIVYIIDENTGELSEKQVKTGMNSDMLVEITDGLEEGNLVVVNPRPSLRDGIRVKANEK